jgi:prephenate dehydrogenase
LERITIVGMGPLGASMGMALKQARLSNTEIVGTSRDRDELTVVSKVGAVDKAESNLRAAVEGAQLVILNATIADTKELLENLGPALEDGCVVTDTGNMKLRAIEWAEASLPKGVGFVGGHPLIKKSLRTMQDADHTVFQNVPYCVIPAKSADQESVKTVVSLVEMLGAKPLFMDAHEHDSYAVAMTHLPIVMSAAYVTATAGSPSWREMHRLAASEFKEFSAMAAGDPLDNETACLANSEEMVRWLDQLILELYSYRNQIAERSDSLIDTLIKAWEARARWEAGAVVEDSSRVNLPSASESMAMAFFGERLVSRYKQMKGKDDKKNWKYTKR